MKKRRVALVLAGGGARGVAHIGAIEELERQGFEISAVAGTSMGALVGGVYASGYLEPFKEWMRALDKYKVFSLVDFALSTEGLVKGDRVMEAMKELVPDVQIERMPVPFAAVAADLLTGDEVVLDSAGLYDAIRASISIPSVFRPVHRDGRVLVDGGTVNPLPLNRVRREEGDLLVAVDVSARFGADSVRRANASLNYYKVLIASSQIMQQRITLGESDPKFIGGNPTSWSGCPPTATACSSSTVRRRFSRRGVRRRARRWSGWKPTVKTVWFLLKAKKRLRRPVFEEFKSSDATSHRF